MRRGEFHLLVDLRGPHVERTPEDVGEPQHVVDLVRVVRTARGEDDVGAREHRGIVGDFGIGVGEGHDDRVAGHRAQHLGRQRVGLRDAQEHVGVVQRLGQRRDAPRGGEFALHRVDVLAVDRDRSMTVAKHHVLAADAEFHEQARAGDGGGSGAVDHDAHFVQLLAGDLRAVQKRRRGDDRRAVLVVVHQGNVQLLAQAGLDLETLRGLDVLEVDASEGGSDGFHRADELLGIGRVDLDVEGVDACIGLEEHAFALHDGLGRQGTDVAQSEDGRAVRDHGHEVALARVFVNVVRLFGDGQRRSRHAGRVGQRQIVLRMIGFGRDDPDLTGAAFAVVAQRRVVELRFCVHLSHFPLVTC